MSALLITWALSLCAVVALLAGNVPAALFAFAGAIGWLRVFLEDES